MFLTRHRRCESAAEAHSTTRRVLGLASIAVGLTEILSPKTLEDTMGINNGENTGILRVLGIREISHGIDLLAHKDPTTGVLARVAGDLLDGVLLTAAAQKSRNPKGMAAIFALVTPIVLADMLLAPHLVKDHAA